MAWEVLPFMFVGAAAGWFMGWRQHRHRTLRELRGTILHLARRERAATDVTTAARLREMIHILEQYELQIMIGGARKDTV